MNSMTWCKRFVAFVILSIGQACGQSQDDITQARAACLSQTNFYRPHCGAQTMTSNDTMNDYAQNWAQHLIDTNSFTHSGGPYGENLYWWSGTGSCASHDFPGTATSAVTSWYDECCNYDDGNFEDWGHFSQLVWKNSQQLGTGIACGDNQSAGTCTVICCCEYNPPGNVGGQYSQNVETNSADVKNICSTSATSVSPSSSSVAEPTLVSTTSPSSTVETTSSSSSSSSISAVTTTVTPSSTVPTSTTTTSSTSSLVETTTTLTTSTSFSSEAPTSTTIVTVTSSSIPPSSIATTSSSMSETPTPTTSTCAQSPPPYGR